MNHISCQGKLGNTYKLGSIIAKGGEGMVCTIVGSPNKVAKIYRTDILKPADIRLRASKIEYMLDLPACAKRDSLCAWPQDALYDANGLFCGYVMKNLQGFEKLSNLLSDDRRLKTHPSKLIATACNLAIATRQVHDSGLVVGDFTPQNIMVDDEAIVSIIDVDSFHISTEDGKVYPCKAGMPEWLPPELQKKTFTNDSFSVQTDQWALAIIIFKLLMNDTHPFTFRVTDANVARSGWQENVISGLSSHFPSSSGWSGKIQKPLTCPPIGSLPQPLRDLFEKTFVTGHFLPNKRPSAEKWINPLQDYARSLVNCQVKPQHAYWAGATECPFCHVDRLSKAPLKIPATQQATTSSTTQPQSTAPSKPQNQYEPFGSATQGSPYRSKDSDGCGVAILAAVLAIVGTIIFVWLLMELLMVLQ